MNTVNKIISDLIDGYSKNIDFNLKTSFKNISEAALNSVNNIKFFFASNLNISYLKDKVIIICNNIYYGIVDVFFNGKNKLSKEIINVAKENNQIKIEQFFSENIINEIDLSNAIQYAIKTKDSEAISKILIIKKELINCRKLVNNKNHLVHSCKILNFEINKTNKVPLLCENGIFTKFIGEALKKKK